MKRCIRTIITTCMVVALLTVFVFSADCFSTEASDDMDVFTDLNQEEITEAMGAGWNLGNQLEAVTSAGYPSETAWGNPKVTAKLIQAVKDQGFSTIRIPVSYLNYIGDADSGYEIDADWLARIHEVVDYAIDAGLYVVINMHGDGYTSMIDYGAWLFCAESDQTEIQAKYAAVWEQIATEFKDYDEHLIFESMNEEFDGTYSTPNKTYYSNINAYNQIFVNTVRQTGGNNAKRWLIVCGWNTDIAYTCGDYGFKIPEDTYLDSSITEPRLMISVHYYTPWDFCGSAATSTYSYTSGDWDDPYANIKKCYDTFVSQGYPVFIGEYGATNQNNESDRVAFVTAVCTAARQYGCIPVIWDNNGHGTGTDKFGLINRSTCAVTQQGIIDAIMDVYSTQRQEQTITVSTTSVSVAVGGTTTITAEASTDVSYASSDTSVATISSVGKITGRAVGTVTITVTAEPSSEYYEATKTITVTVKPAAPSISSLENTSSGVKITWSKVTGATGYYVYRKAGSGGTWIKYDTITSGSTVTYTDRSTSSGTTYSYKIYAYASTGTSAASASKSIMRLSSAKISSVTNATSGITVKWSKITGANGYYVYRKLSGGNYSLAGTITSGSTVSYTDTAVKSNSGKTYTYYVIPYFKNSSGAITKGTNANTKTIMRLSSATVSSLTNGSSGITVKWGKITGANGYYIYRKVSGGSYSVVKTITSGSTVSYTDTAVKSKNGTTYYYYVIPYYKNSGGAITKGSYANTKTTVRLTAVSISSLTNSSSKKMTVKWGKNSSATGYQIQYSTFSSFSSYSTVTVTSASTVSKVIGSLTKGKTYYVRVRAYKTISSTKYYSAWSSTKSVKISS